MLTEFALLTALTLNSDEREVLRDKIDEWVKCFLPKLERESTREEKCRLIASVERQEFERFWSAREWRFCKFVGKNGFIFDEYKNKLEEFKVTSFQKRILRRNPNLSDVFIGRSEIEEENGKWNLKNELKDQLLSEGGEAIVLSQKFGENLMALRVAVFDSFLFTKKFCAGQIKWRTHLISDFEKATKNRSDDALVVPVHENVIRNFANIEIFDSGDKEEEDCLGWISIMEKCDGNLREKLKNGNATLDERKKIATGIKSGLEYLKKVGIFHCDKKLANFLFIGDVAKVCDFGLVWEISGRKSYRKLGYTRRGSKYRNDFALFAGTPGFAGRRQLGGLGIAGNDYFMFLFCDWKTIWSLNYRPIDDQEKNEIDKIILSCGVQNIKDKYGDINEDHVIENITKIISLKNASVSFVFDDPNLTKSCQMSNLKQQMTKCVNLTMQNLTKNILDQKWSNLCVPISVTTLLRFAIKNDLAFVDKKDSFTFDKILTTLTMMVYPRSLAGLNLNPKKEGNQFQRNDIETLLERICKKTYLKESGWEIIRTQGRNPEPAESTCEFEKGNF
ncbi:unnamed protein product [Oikopleura dioica]|uniref:Protein kinase domain-containing protein n=1 Tax=Oikopleura dioica TaxID=34765 RepID=E4XZJ8_OIKDI|nr:unnamed protein product [Oikopleura dioica]